MRTEADWRDCIPDGNRPGSPEGFTIRIRDIILNCGSEMIVAIAGDMLRMPLEPSLGKRGFHLNLPTVRSLFLYLMAREDSKGDPYAKC